MGYTSLTVGGLNARPVKFGMQFDQMYVWVEHETMGGTTPLSFTIVGTGHSIGTDYKHVETIFDGDYVWHLYYRHGL